MRLGGGAGGAGAIFQPPTPVVGWPSWWCCTGRPTRPTAPSSRG
ncbi:MAG: hypothetical protein WKG07_44285 [Hymenobacter sp.]